MSPFTIFIHHGMLYVRNFVGIPSWHKSHESPKEYVETMRNLMHPQHEIDQNLAVLNQIIG